MLESPTITSSQTQCQNLQQYTLKQDDAGIHCYSFLYLLNAGISISILTSIVTHDFCMFYSSKLRKGKVKKMIFITQWEGGGKGHLSLLFFIFLDASIRRLLLFCSKCPKNCFQTLKFFQVQGQGGPLGALGDSSSPPLVLGKYYHSSLEGGL